MTKVLRGRWTQVLTVVGVVVLVVMVAGLVVGSVFALKHEVSVSTWIMIWTAVYAAFNVFIALVLFAAAVAAVHQLRSMERARQGQLDLLVEAEKARRAQVLTELSKRWDDPLFSESRRKVSSFEGDPEGLSRRLRELDRKNHRDFYVFIRVANFFEDLALLVDEDAVSLELVEKSLGTPVGYYWNLFRCYILAEQQQEPATFEHFARLVEKLKEG